MRAMILPGVEQRPTHRKPGRPLADRSVRPPSTWMCSFTLASGSIVRLSVKSLPVPAGHQAEGIRRSENTETHCAAARPWPCVAANLLRRRRRARPRGKRLEGRDGETHAEVAEKAAAAQRLDMDDFIGWRGLEAGLAEFSAARPEFGVRRRCWKGAESRTPNRSVEICRCPSRAVGNRIHSRRRLCRRRDRGCRSSASP
jgi:hypothetical protein